MQFARPKHLKISISCPSVARCLMRPISARTYPVIYTYICMYLAYIFVYSMYRHTWPTLLSLGCRCCSNFVFAHSGVNRFVCQSDNQGPVSAQPGPRPVPGPDSSVTRSARQSRVRLFVYGESCTTHHHLSKRGNNSQPDNPTEAVAMAVPALPRVGARGKGGSRTDPGTTHPRSEQPH